MNKNGIINENKRYPLKRPITGIIQEDRIWEQWYDPKKMEEKLPKMNQADYLYECNKDFGDQVILNNRGLKKFTNDEFTELRNSFIRSLKALGVQKGDIIATVSLSTPELVALKYAAAYLGAITSNLNFADVKNHKMYDEIKDINPKYIFFLDIFENQVAELFNIDEFKNIGKIRLPLSASTPIINLERLKIALLEASNKIKKMTVKNAISYNHFRNVGRYELLPEESIYSEKLPSNIAFTSGTTGKNKAILLSHDANNALAKQHEIANLGLNRGEKNLALVPPFLAFWDADIIHMAMCLGIENILELALTYENVPKYLLKHLPNYGIWSQYLWDSILHMPFEERQKVCKNLKKVVVGGERADVSQINTFQNLTGIIQDAGYGASEMDSCFSVAHPNCNMKGSGGLPLPFNNVMVKDESGNDLTYNQPGKLYITGPAMMSGYYQNQELTDKVLIRDSKGKLWYDTKDYGYVDRTGSLFVLDRYQQPIIINSKSVNLLDIAEKIKGCQDIKICKVNSCDNKIVLHVTFDEFINKSARQLEEDLIDYLTNYLSPEEQPDIICIQKSLPRTATGKVDYVEIAKTTNELVKEVTEKSKMKILRR